MNETKNCKDCKHAEQTEPSRETLVCCGYFDYHITMGDNNKAIAAICKHYAAPEPSEFEKVWRCFVRAQDTTWVYGPHSEVIFRAGYEAGRKVGRKQRGEDDVKALPPCSMGEHSIAEYKAKAIQAIRKLNEDVDDG